MYEGHDHYFKAFRQDSIEVSGNSDTLFYSYRAIRDSAGYPFICRDTTNGDALGRRIYKNHDGWFRFFNRNNDTIRINASAALNQSWNYCALPDSDFCYLQATVTGIMLDSIAGTTDSVKVITFQAKNAFGVNIPGIFNQKEVRLSKHYGLSKIYDIYHTPFDTLPLVLIGKTTPQMGVQPFTWTDVYDYNEGDEFHYSGYHTYGSATVTWKTINKILGKTVYGNMDSVHYLVEMCKKTWDPFGNTTTIHDTIVESHNFILLANDAKLRMLPDEFSRSIWTAPAFSRTFSDYNHRQAQIYNMDGYFYYSYDSCFNDPFESWGPVSWYVPGLGVTKYMYWYADATVESYSNELVYFKKGSEIWRTPVATDCSSLVGIDEKPVPEEPSVVVFPNPAVTRVRVMLRSFNQEEPFHFALYNYAGIKVFDAISPANPAVIDRNDLPSGLYILVITEPGGRTVGKTKVFFQ